MNFIQTLGIQFLHMQINSVFIYLKNKFSLSLSIFRKYIKTSLVTCMGILGTVPPRNDNYCIQTILFFQKHTDHVLEY